MPIAEAPPLPIKMCPATMCPLIAPNGSPWTGTKNNVCPGHDREEGGCGWWSMGCGSQGQVGTVAEALADGGRAFVVGPNKPKRDTIGAPKTYDCPRANDCRWQEQSPTGLCAPREALRQGIDPRVCLF